MANITIDTNDTKLDGGSGYFAAIEPPVSLLTKTIPDTPNNPKQSTLQIFEDGKPLELPHSLHADIRSKGFGRFSHWGDGIYFSSSDNADPVTSGRTYSLSFPFVIKRSAIVFGVAILGYLIFFRYVTSLIRAFLVRPARTLCRAPFDHDARTSVQEFFRFRSIPSLYTLQFFIFVCLACVLFADNGFSYAFLFKMFFTTLVFVAIQLVLSIKFSVKTVSLSLAAYALLVVFGQVLSTVPSYYESYLFPVSINQKEHFKIRISTSPGSPKWQQIDPASATAYLFIGIPTPLEREELSLKLGTGNLAPIQSFSGFNAHKWPRLGNHVYTVPLDWDAIINMHHLDIELLIKPQKQIWFPTAHFDPMKQRDSTQQYLFENDWKNLSERIGPHRRLLVEIRIVDADNRVLGALN